MDVDGVLTDGRIRLQSLPDGSALEMKVFSAYDGAGLKMARAVGLRTGLITGRDSPATTRRAQEVGMEFVFQDRAEKLAAYEEILHGSGLRDADVAYVGDDLPDLPVLTRPPAAGARAWARPPRRPPPRGRSGPPHTPSPAAPEAAAPSAKWWSCCSKPRGSGGRQLSWLALKGRGAQDLRPNSNRVPSSC